MARLTDDDFAILRSERERGAGTPFGGLRAASGAQRNEAAETWLAAGDTLAEKAIAALDVGDDDRAARLVSRILALPVVDSARSGPMAVGLVLFGELLDPQDDEPSTALLDPPLRLLPTLDPPVADELRRVLAAMTDFDLPAAVLRRIRTVVPPERRFDEPFEGVTEADLPAAVTGVLRLVLALRTDR